MQHVLVALQLENHLAAAV